MASLQESLANLPVFEGASDEARRRSLLTAGLALMQPYNPLEGSPLTQLSGGIGAGLGELDRQTDREAATEQQAFQNLIAGRGAAAEEERAAAATTQAEAAQTQAATGQVRAETEQKQADTAAAKVQQAAEQFNALADMRAAEINLKEAEAEWLRRRYGGAPAGSQAAALEANRIEATMKVLVSQNPERYTLADGNLNAALARVDAYKAIGIDDEIIKNESLGIILTSAGEAGEVRQNIEGLTTQFGPPVESKPVGGDNTPQPKTADEVRNLPSGTEYIWLDGKRYKKN